MSTKFISNDTAIQSFHKKISKIHTNYAFQRPEGNWTKTDKIDFIQSVFNGFNSNPIVVANIQQCSDYSADIGDHDSDSYFHSLYKKGFRFVSLDGQHRTQTIKEFLNSEWGFTGEIELSNGETVAIVNQLFKDMDVAVQNTFYMKNVLFQQFTSATRSQMAPIFIAINSGSPLTNQHMRNALASPLPKVIRDLVSKYPKFVKTYYSKENHAKMKPHEDASKMLIHYTNKEDRVFKKDLDKFYGKGLSDGIDGKFSQSYNDRALQTLKSALSYMEQISYMVGKNSFIENKPSLLLMALVLGSVVENNYEIKSMKKFVKNIEKLDEKLKNDGEAKRVADIANGQSVVDDHYYDHWKSQNWHITRKDRQEALWDEILKNPASFGVALEEESEEVA
jgi:hypothetical protein